MRITPDDTPEDMKAALDCIEKAAFDDAYTIARNAINGGSPDVRYWFVAAQACIYQENFAGLEEIADGLLQIASDMVIGHIWKGDARRQVNDRAATYRHYKDAISHADKQSSLPPAVVSALERAKMELPTLRRQLGED